MYIFTEFGYASRILSVCVLVPILVGKKLLSVTKIRLYINKARLKNI